MKKKKKINKHWDEEKKIRGNKMNWLYGENAQKLYNRCIYGITYCTRNSKLLTKLRMN